MTHTIKRRTFLSGSAAAAAVACAGPGASAGARPKQEIHELRVYQAKDAATQTIVGTYLKQALLPALNRQGIDRIGVFTEFEKPDSNDIFVLIPFKTWESFSEVTPRLMADGAYLKAAADYFARPKKQSAYARIWSRLMKAFAGMPTLEPPPKGTGIYELRTYESHTEKHAFLKVDMFNTGEIQVMRDVKLGPVFFGETLVADDVPNLTYMLSAPNLDEHNKHWKAFGAHPEWKRMKALPKYKDTVSKITKWYLKPESYSEI